MMEKTAKFKIKKSNVPEVLRAVQREIIDAAYSGLDTSVDIHITGYIAATKDCELPITLPKRKKCW